MAIALDNSAKLFSSGSASPSWAYVVSGTDRGLIVFVSLIPTAGRTITSVTYNGVALTSLGITLANSIVGSTITAWFLSSPATGSNTLQVNLDGATEVAALPSSWTGVDQTTGYRAPSSVEHEGAGNLNISVSVNNADANDVIVDGVVGYRQGLTVNGAQTLLQNQTNQYSSNLDIGSSYKVAAGGATAMAWTETTSGFWGIIAVPLIPAGGGGGPSDLLMGQACL
jgi:hypothetical protein